MTIYPLTVHDLWLALTRLPPYAQSLPICAGRGEEYADIVAVDMAGPDGNIALELSMTLSTNTPANELAAAQADVLKMLSVFELTVLYPKVGPPPPPIPMTDAVRALLTDIRTRYEQAAEEDEIPF